MNHFLNRLASRMTNTRSEKYSFEINKTALFSPFMIIIRQVQFQPFCSPTKEQGKMNIFDVDSWLFCLFYFNHIEM